MDRIARIRIANLRSIEHVELDLSPLTVLIGENGSGKSTIVEALELLRKASEPSFVQQVHAVHRGLAGLLRKGATNLTLGVVIEDDDLVQPSVEYLVTLLDTVGGAEVVREWLVVRSRTDAEPVLFVLRREGSTGEMLDAKGEAYVRVPQPAMASNQLVLTSFGAVPPHAAFARVLAMLRGIEVHLPFDTLAAWAARSHQFSLSLRTSTPLFPTERLNLLGFNFASAWAALRNRGSTDWDHTMRLVRLGLGEGIDSVNVDPAAGGGLVAVSVKRTDLAQPIPASDLSDGQLSWLAFVAMTRLHPDRSLLAIDEPESHLHPSLLGRVVSLLVEMEGRAPVLVATHSDRVLELLDDPADAVRVCQSDERGVSSVHRLDPAELPVWLKEFGDLGELRQSGYLSRVVLPATSSSDEATP